jgi:hypothetical protein
MSLAPHTPPPRRADNPSPTGTLPAWLADTPPASAPSAGSFATVEPPRSTASVYDTPAYYAPARSAYRPTAEQLARDELRLAYWRRSVRLPIIIATVVVALLFIALFVLAFAGPWLGFDTAAARSLIAGLSGLTIIFIALPLTALMGLLPLTYAAWWFNRRQNRKLNPESGPMAYRSRVQTLLWQLDSLLDKAQRGTTQGGTRVTRPLIGLHARADYWREFVRGLRRNFKPDNNA